MYNKFWKSVQFLPVKLVTKIISFNWSKNKRTKMLSCSQYKLFSAIVRFKVEGFKVRLFPENCSNASNTVIEYCK